MPAAQSRAQPRARSWRLTPAELRSYGEAGLVRPALRFDDATVAGLRDLLEETLAATAGQRPESVLCPHIAGVNGLPDAIAARWLALCREPRLLDVVADAIGPDIILWGSQLFCKPAGNGLRVPWHQDGHFWPIRPLATCSVWVAIDDVDTENGAMRFVPGSHRRRALFPHAHQPGADAVLNAELPADQVNVAEVADNVLKAGEFSLHDVYLVHGSEPNRSARRRAGFAIRYMPAASHYDREMARPGSSLVDTRLATRPIFLLRGEDRTGKTGLADLRLDQQSRHATSDPPSSDRATEVPCR